MSQAYWDNIFKEAITVAMSKWTPGDASKAAAEPLTSEKLKELTDEYNRREKERYEREKERYEQIVRTYEEPTSRTIIACGGAVVVHPSKSVVIRSML